MVRRRQQDLESGQQIVAPKASAVNLNFGVQAPKPVEAIAFDFRSLSRSLDQLAGRASQDRERMYEKTAEEARQVFAKAQLEGVDSENELFERWQEHAANQGLTEAATVHGQREIARATGRGKAAHVISQVRIRVEDALSSEGEVPENSDTFWKEALEAADIDLEGLDFYQMEGFGPLSERARIEFDQALGEEDYMRDTAIIHEAAQSRVVGYLQGPELTIEGLSEVVGGLSTSENGSLYPVNRKPILMNALKQMQVELTGDSESFLEILDVAEDLDFGGTRFGDDQSSPDLPSGRQGETYDLQLARMRRQAVVASDKEASDWQTKSTARINKAIGTNPEYWQSIDSADDAIMTSEQIGEKHEEISSILANAGLTAAEVANGMQKWSASVRTAQTNVRSSTAATIRATQTEQKLETASVRAGLSKGDLSPEDVYAMTNVPGAEEIYGAEGIMLMQKDADATANLMTFTSHPTTARVGEILSSTEGFEALSVSELNTLTDESNQSLAEIQSAFQDMMLKSVSLPPAGLQIEVENFLKSPLVTDAVERKRKSTEEARIKTANREVELKRITGVLNTTALREIAGDESLPTSMRIEAEAGITLADRSSITQTWGQFNGYMRRLGGLLDVQNASEITDEDMGTLEALLDRQNAGAATRFQTMAREFYTQQLEGNESPPTVVQERALEFALKSFEKEASDETRRQINAQRVGGAELLQATTNNDNEAADRDTRVAADRSKNRREFDTFFPADPVQKGLRANETTIRNISNDLFDAAETVYALEPGGVGWSEAQQALQIEGRKAANAILTEDDDGELSDEQAQQLFNIGQITPGFWSLDDIAETGMITHRTEANKALIVKLQAEKAAIEKEFAPVLAQRRAMMEKASASIGGRKGVVDTFVDRQIFGRLSEERDKFLKLQQTAHHRVLEALKEARQFDTDQLKSASSALEATTAGNINALTVPWKRSYEELQKYKDQKPANWDRFLAAIGIVDEQQFLKEQRKIYQ